jgi:2-dehydropantoate 2-reductase
LNDRNDIVQLGKLPSLRWGTIDGRDDGLLPYVRAPLVGAGFDAATSATIYQDIWEKWTLLTALGTICILMRGSIGDANSIDIGPELFRKIIDKVAAVDTAVGTPPHPENLQGVHGALTNQDTPMPSWLYRDLMQSDRFKTDQIEPFCLRNGLYETDPRLNCSRAGG